MTYKDLIDQIEKYAAASNLSPAQITARAVGNRRLYDTLTNDGGCTIHIAEKLCRWIEDNPAGESVT
jgi:hypothetical protein